MTDNTRYPLKVEEGNEKISKIQIVNHKLLNLTVKKVDSKTGKGLAGAVFSVKLVDGQAVEGSPYTTGVDGTFTIENLSLGKTEAPNGYVIKEKFKDTFLSAGNDQSITFENSPKSALIIRKIDEETGEALSGIKFEVKYLSGAAGTEGTTIGTYTTSKNGTIVISGLKAGVYSVAEISTDDRHILDETLKTATLADDNSVVTLEFTNAPKGGLLIKKYDAVTKEPLSDVIFKITDIRGAVVGESGGEYRTDETGTIYIPNLVGGYIVSEVKAKDGYMLDNTAKTIYIEKGRVYSLEFFNQPKNSLIIVKMDGTTKEPLSDAVIKVSTVKDTLIGEYRTDTSGTITVNNLEPGTYKIQEIKQPENYILDDTVKLVTLEQNDSKKVELFNYKTASLIINKVDKTTQKVLSGAKFKVSQIDGTVEGEYITGDDGRIIVPNLKPNWYVVTEISAPKGYNIDSKPSKNVQVKAYEPSVVTFENYKNATLRIRKTDYVTGDEIENCKFLITRNDGKTYGTYTTDRFGEINLENVLPAGTYIIRETDVPKGYALDTNARKVTLDWGDDKLIEWENYPLASIKIIKTDSENDEPISGVEFEVFDSKKESLGKYTTDSKGKIELSKMFVEGTYYIEESELEGYVPVKGLQTVKTKWGKTTTVEVENEPIMGKVQIHKTAADNNSVTGTLKDSGLRGAKYTIYDSNGKKS